MTNPLTHDPFYRRVKDVLIVMVAVYAMFPALKDKMFGKEAETPEIIILRNSMEDVKSRLNRLEYKIDRMASYQRRDSER